MIFSVFLNSQEDTLGALRRQPSTVIMPASPLQKFRGSIAFTEGFEKNLHVLAKDQYPDRAMAIFTSGGDAQGNWYRCISFVHAYQTHP